MINANLLLSGKHQRDCFVCHCIGFIYHCIEIFDWTFFVLAAVCPYLCIGNKNKMMFLML